MTSKSRTPVPYLIGLALTFDQLNTLARYLLTDKVVDDCDDGDPAYALELFWEEQGIESAILDLGDQPRHYLYVLDVFPSFDGTAPRAIVKEEFLKKFRDEIGDAWKSVKVLSRRWPNEPGMPEPDWLYSKMHKTIRRMKSKQPSRT